jgi:alpha-L-arabinofuranosidase
VLTAKNKGDFNSLDNPGVVKPVEQPLKTGKNNVDVSLAANSLNVITIPYK